MISNNQLTIDTNRLPSSVILWNRIEVENGATLIIKNNSMTADVKIAVKALNGTTESKNIFR